MVLRAFMGAFAAALCLLAATSSDAEPTDAIARACAGDASSPQCRDALRDESFVSAQLAAFDETAAAMARVGARAAARSDALGDAARDTEMLQRRRQALSEELASFKSRGIAGREADTVAERLRVTDQDLDAQGVSLRKTFPEYAEMITPRPVSRAEAQALLRDDEVLVLFSRPGSSVFVWAITRNEAKWARLPLTERALGQRILGFRRHLDSTAGCMDPQANIASPGGPTAGVDFDLGLSNALYNDLFGPVRTLVEGKRSVILVPHGALMSLPFAALSMRAPPSPEATPDILRATRWLGVSHALSVLPAASALRALRCPRRDGSGACVARVRPNGQRRAFAGIGAPRLGGGGAYADPCARGLRMSGELADQQGLAGLAPLAGAESELQQLRTLYGPSSSTLFTGVAATERVVRTTRLDDVEVISFSTHGLLAQEAMTVAGISEGGLVLTPPTLQSPPRAPDLLDDGFLTATEASELRLNADWVILSACNTAQGGRVGDAALSGLARAFFFAGARALLVSQWPVDDIATERLMVEALRRNKGGVPRGEALRAAMQAILNDRADDRFAHPSAWAPFILVGDGG